MDRTHILIYSYTQYARRHTIHKLRVMVGRRNSGIGYWLLARPSVGARRHTIHEWTDYEEQNTNTIYPSTLSTWFDFAHHRPLKTGSLRVVRDVEPRITKDEMRGTGNGKMFHVKQSKRRR